MGDDQEELRLKPLSLQSRGVPSHEGYFLSSSSLIYEHFIKIVFPQKCLLGKKKKLKKKNHPPSDVSEIELQSALIIILAEL